MMASLRYAIRAYAAEGDAPADAPHQAVGARERRPRRPLRDSALRHRSTSPAHRITLANAGHPEPLLVDAAAAPSSSRPASACPIGVTSPAPYREVTVAVPPGATLLLYTDGLVERRGESLDVGLERLRPGGGGASGSLDELLSAILHDGDPARIRRRHRDHGAPMAE